MSGTHMLPRAGLTSATRPGLANICRLIGEKIDSQRNPSLILQHECLIF